MGRGHDGACDANSWGTCPGVSLADHPQWGLQSALAQHKKAPPPKLSLAGLNRGGAPTDWIGMTLPGMRSRVDCDTPKLPTAPLRLLVELRKRAQESDDGAVVAARDDLAQALGVSDRTIRRARAALTAAELIAVTGPDQRYCGNTYTVL